MREATADAVVRNCILGGKKFVAGKARMTDKAWVWNPEGRVWESPRMHSDLTIQFATMETDLKDDPGKRDICIVKSAIKFSQAKKGLKWLLSKPLPRERKEQSASWAFTANGIETFTRLAPIDANHVMIIVGHRPDKNTQESKESRNLTE